MRGSAWRLRYFCRCGMCVNRNSSPSQPYHITFTCGAPSGRVVPRCAEQRPLKEVDVGLWNDGHGATPGRRRRVSTSTPPTCSTSATGISSRRLLAGRPVDRLADQVGVAVVAGVLLDHVALHPARRHVVTVALPRADRVERVEAVKSLLGRPPSRRYPGPPVRCACRVDEGRWRSSSARCGPGPCGACRSTLGVVDGRHQPRPVPGLCGSGPARRRSPRSPTWGGGLPRVCSSGLATPGRSSSSAVARASVLFTVC